LPTLITVKCIEEGKIRNKETAKLETSINAYKGTKMYFWRMICHVCKMIYKIKFLIPHPVIDLYQPVYNYLNRELINRKIELFSPHWIS
jgi:hypothetical protein